MSFNVKPISVFERQAKRLVKKFPELLTPDWYDRETGRALDREQVRGIMPGVR